MVNEKIAWVATVDSARMTLFSAVLLVILTLIVTVPANSDIFVFSDADGVRHFTNAPTSPKYKFYLHEPAPRRARPTPVLQYDPLIADAARTLDLPFHLLKAVIHVESDFDPRAVSQKGALGLMQIMPDNLDLLEVRDPFDPQDNIRGGARYLKAMLDRFGGQLNLALAAYNAGPGAVEHYNGIPPFPETRDYVEKVMKFISVYKNG